MLLKTVRSFFREFPLRAPAEVGRTLFMADRWLAEEADRFRRRVLRPHRKRADLPIFIVGSGRCGTTLLGVMLNSHPRIAVTPETHFMVQALYKIWRTRDLRTMVTWLLEGNQHAAEAGVVPTSLLREVRRAPHKTAAAVLDAFYGIYARAAGKPRWGDNTPSYCTLMREIDRLLGGAAFVHVIRDGRDVALSLMPLGWGPSTLEQAATYWRRRVEMAREAAFDVTAYTEIRYESLVEHPAQTLQELCEFLGEAFSADLLDHTTSARRRMAELQVARAGGATLEQRLESHQRIAHPTDTSRVERWRREMTGQQLAEFLKVAGDTLSSLGYSLH